MQYWDILVGIVRAWVILLHLKWLVLHPCFPHLCLLLTSQSRPHRRHKEEIGEKNKRDEFRAMGHSFLRSIICSLNPISGNLNVVHKTNLRNTCCASHPTAVWMGFYFSAASLTSCRILRCILAHVSLQESTVRVCQLVCKSTFISQKQKCLINTHFNVIILHRLIIHMSAVQVARQTLTRGGQQTCPSLIHTSSPLERSLEASEEDACPLGMSSN